MGTCFLSILCANQLKTSISPPPGHLNFDHSNSHPLGPKWYSNALPYRWICPSYLLKNNCHRLLACLIKTFRRPFFLSQSLTNATSLPLNSSILLKHVFIAVSDFSARKKKKFETWHFRFDFFRPKQAKVNFPTPWAQRIVKCPRIAWEVGFVEVSI